MACSGTARTWPMLDIFWALAQSYYQVTGQMGYGHLWYKNQRIKCRQEKLFKDMQHSVDYVIPGWLM